MIASRIPSSNIYVLLLAIMLSSGCDQIDGKIKDGVNSLEKKVQAPLASLSKPRDDAESACMKWAELRYSSRAIDLMHTEVVGYKKFRVGLRYELTDAEIAKKRAREDEHCRKYGDGICLRSSFYRDGWANLDCYTDNNVVVKVE